MDGVKERRGERGKREGRERVNIELSLIIKVTAGGVTEYTESFI